MSLDIAAIRTAVADKVSAAWAAQGWVANVYSYDQMAVVMDCLIVHAPTSVDYHGTMSPGAVAHVAFDMEYRANGTGIDSYKRAESVLSTGTNGSLFDALAADRYLLSGLAGVAAVIRSATGPQPVVTDSASYVFCTFQLQAFVG